LAARVTIVTPEEAIGRLRADHDLLLARVTGLTGARLRAGYRPASGPLGDFCESLHDLIAHVLMSSTVTAAGTGRWPAASPGWSTGSAAWRRRCLPYPANPRSGTPPST
jgi:hypothetical protein